MLMGWAFIEKIKKVEEIDAEILSRKEAALEKIKTKTVESIRY